MVDNFWADGGTGIRASLRCLWEFYPLEVRVLFRPLVIGSLPAGRQGVPLKAPEVYIYGRLAQLARASRLHREGYRFESYIVHTSTHFVRSVQAIRITRAKFI